MTYFQMSLTSSRPYFLKKLDPKENEEGGGGSRGEAGISNECQEDADCTDPYRPKCALHRSIPFFAPEPKVYKMCIQETLCNKEKEISDVIHKYECQNTDVPLSADPYDGFYNKKRSECDISNIGQQDACDNGDVCMLEQLVNASHMEDLRSDF